jgi:hypothetical protein|tara:strand:- start:18058 stop:18732 length:675 start_codon:yes stop_codon:yes gene_type:complete
MEWFSNEDYNDRWVAEVFDYKENGYFVEIGACSGTRKSSCYSLEKYLKWQGPAVEPHSKYWKECKTTRFQPINVCVYNYDGTVEYMECEGKIPERNWGAEGLSGITKELHLYHKKYYDKFGTPVIKTCITPTTLLNNCNAPRDIDYVGIDTEGSEYEILKCWPFDQYTVKLFSVEADGNDADIITDFLKSKDYIKVVNPFCTVHYEQHYCHISFIEQYKYNLDE